MTRSIIPVILSGGSGTRLWPLSRSMYPKQFINFFKNLAIAGGFLVLAAHGAGKFSVDGVIAARRAKGGA